ncbi:MAG TPA: hypothetical protein VMW42_06375, partial [Desulfatiglandales bacterium]|nr:hypothetical protein [Desulfatiglandales bacterium]
MNSMIYGEVYGKNYRLKNWTGQEWSKTICWGRLCTQVRFRPPHLTLTVDIKSSCPYYGLIETSSILKKAHFDLE